MKLLANVLALGICVWMTAGPLAAFQSRQPAPDWAYGYLKPLGASDQTAPPCPPTAKPFPDCAYAGAPVAEDGVKHELPGAASRFTHAEIYFDFGPADWYPDDHPPMPEIVAKGRQAAGIRACALCHYPNGQGKMENGGVAGLPAAYILDQLKAFKSGARRSADARKANTNEMAQIARLLTSNEAKAAADYFASMRWRPWTKVVEADMAPAVRSTVNGLFLSIAGADPIALGNRIIEVAANPERTDVTRDPRSGFIAYAPMGSIAQGETLATGGAGKTKACGLCHGQDLRGMGNVPGIAGRTTSYLMRQLWDIHQGTRKSPVMTPMVAKLDVEDLLDLVAYVASRVP